MFEFSGYIVFEFRYIEIFFEFLGLVVLVVDRNGFFGRVVGMLSGRW